MLALVAIVAIGFVTGTVVGYFGGRKDAQVDREFEARVWAAYTEAIRRYDRLPPETSTLDRLAYIYGPNGSGLILGTRRDR